jgi:hypothetical protein
VKEFCLNLKHLGDALDHWKADIIVRLEEAHMAHDVHVLPMFSDRGWSGDPLRTYRRLLRRNPNQIVQAQRRFRTPTRDEYLRCANERWSGDLFVDPDTGIHEKPSKKILTPKNVAVLLSADPNRIVFAYQHHPQRRALTDALKLWQRRVDAVGSEACILWSGQVALFAFSQHNKRLRRVEQFLRTLVRGSVEERVVRLLPTDFVPLT